MSGLCGWVGGHEEGAAKTLAAMGRALSRHTAGSVRTESGERCALAVSPEPAAAHVQRRGDLCVAIDGRPHWPETDLAAMASRDGNAAALIEGFRRYRENIIPKLNGSFALAIVDGKRDETWLAVDRMGIRPLAYACTEAALIFGSSVEAIRAHPALDSRIDPQSIFEYLYFNMIPSPRTIYVGVSKLEPAQWLHYHNGKCRRAYYWAPAFQDDTEASFERLALELRAALRNAVARNSAGCDAGMFLSGGVDSSTVCGMYSQLCNNRPARTFSIGFQAEGYDELGYARIAARHFRATPHEYYVTAADVAQALPTIAQLYDEPFGNSSALAVYYCARLAKGAGVSTLLAGDGGDELFGGNARYAKQKAFEWYKRIPRGVRRGLEPLLLSSPFVAKIPLLKKARSYVQQALIPLPDRLESYNQLHRTPLAEIFMPEFLRAIDPQQPLAMLRATYGRASAESALDRMLYLDWKFTLADNDLRKVNRMCEAQGIEARYPMLDDELVALSTRIPAGLKVRGLTLRYFFKRALRDFLPAEVIAKSKHGFGLPFGTWLRTTPALQSLVDASLERLARRGYVRREFIKRLMRAHRSEHAAYYGHAIWVLVTLDLWLEAHALRASGSRAN